MTDQIEFLKSGEWVMRITADRRIEVNEDVTVTEAAQNVLEALQTLLEQPEKEPVALIRDGVLRWYIPHEHYSRPAWTAHGTHMLYTAQAQQQAEPVANQFNAGVEACMSRLNEMHRIASGRHNYYRHAALELAKLKGEA